MEIPNDQIEAALSAPVATRQLYSKTVSKRYLADAKVYGMGSLGGMLSVGGMMLTYQSYQDSVLSKQEGYTIYYGAMLIGGFLVLVAFITGIRAQLRRKRDTKANQEAATPSVADQPLKPPETNWPEHDRR